MAGRHEWRHNWIPLTPAAALIKAKGSKTTAAKLRQKHGVKSSSTRDVVRASRQQSIPEPSRRPESTVTREARMAEEQRLRTNADVVARTRPTPSSADLSDAAAIFKARNPGKPIAGNEREVSRIADDLWRAKRLRGTDTGNTEAQKAAERARIRESLGGDQRIASRLLAEKTGGTRPKTQGELLAEADARRTKPLEMTLRRQAEQDASHPIGATVDARQPGIDKVTRGRIVGREGNGMLKVEYEDRHGQKVVGTFNPSHTTVVGSKSSTPSNAPHLLKPGETATVRGVDGSGQPITLTGVVDGNSGQTIYKRGRKTGGEPVRAISLKREGASGMTRSDVVYVPDPSRGEQRRGVDELAAARARRASEQSNRAAELRDRAAAERAKLQGIADRAGPPTTDPQANRLSARGLKQAHRNTDSSLRRFTETQQRANALESQAHLADARAKEAGRTRLTRADVDGATHIVDQHGQAREVVRVNAKTVTVKTPYSWTETVPIEKIRRAIKATPEQIAEARRRAALRK